MPRDREAAGPQDSAGPVRMCVICRRRFAKAELSRYVLAAEGALVADERKIRPGRGWYVCPDPACMAKFAKYRPGRRRKGGSHE